MLRLDHWSESLRGLNNPRGRGENDAISDRGVVEVTIASFLIPTTRVFKPRRDSSEVTIASFLIPTTRVFKPRRDSFGGLTDLEPMPGSAGEAA